VGMFFKSIARAREGTMQALDIKAALFYTALIIALSVPISGHGWSLSALISMLDINIALSASLVLIAVFIANLIIAPYRILKEENVSLKAEIDKYQSTAQRDTVKIDGDEIDGTWYGNKFVLDSPLNILKLEETNTDFSVIFAVPCPKNSLAELRYNLNYEITGNAAYGVGGNAFLALGIPGRNKEPKLTGSGKEQIPVGKNCEVEILVKNEMGIKVIIDIDLLGWEEYGDG